MCTGLTLTYKDFYFGRNLDLDYHFGEEVVVTPQSYPLTFKKLKTLESHYGMVGMATVMENYPLYAEAVNDQGLGMAGLNFPGYAHYTDPVEGKSNVTPYEIIPWVLGQCSSCAQAKELLKDALIVNIPFMPKVPCAPLHWLVADKEGSFVVEQTLEGLTLTDNPAGVLTNNPKISYHLENLRNYMNLSAEDGSSTFAEGLDLQPFGVGMASHGLPGDPSPASRFVKAAFLRNNSRIEVPAEAPGAQKRSAEEQAEAEELAAVAQFFHILDNVAMVRGSVVNPQKRCDITTYSCCVNTRTGDYYYKTYENNQINCVSLANVDPSSTELRVYPLQTKESINQLN